MCDMLPWPDEGVVSWPGCAFAKAINSLMLRTGTEGCTETKCGTEPANVTGVKSRYGSNGSLA